MADVVPSGPLSLPFSGCAKLLAASETFRELMTPEGHMGTLSESEVLAYIDYPKSTRDGGSQQPQIPLAVISSDDQDQWEMTVQRHSYGTLLLSLLISIPEEYLDDPPNAELYFRNTVGAIFDEMYDVANTPAGDGSVYWNMVLVRQVIAPAECDNVLRPDGVDPYYGGTWEVTYV